MAKFEWVETFISLEGEAQYTGKPTVYVRFAKCNFQCRGFNNKDMLDTTDIKVLGFDPKDYISIYDIPVIDKGCDSSYSWNPAFSHMWKTGDQVQLAKELTDLIPSKSWIHPTSGLQYALSLTGGEPSLRAKFLPQLLNDPQLDECMHIIFETNCAVPLKMSFIAEINQWLAKDKRRKWTWSNSPKLSSSGEKWDEAIRPEIAHMQTLVTGRTGWNQGEQYFKFVVGDQNDLDEVCKAMDQYYQGGISRDTPVWLMPMACTTQQQDAIARDVADLCIERGYLMSYRLQNALWGNTVGS